MFRRNALMQRTALSRGTTIRNIEEYNAQASAAEQLPYIAVIADEVADLGKEERAILSTLVRMAGAAGLVFYIMTQYPTVDAIPSQIQSNATNRLVMKITPTDLRVALRLGSGEVPAYDPSAITVKGAAILRREGREVFGRVPEMHNELRVHIIDNLVHEWPRTAPTARPATPLRPAATPTAPDTAALLHAALERIAQLEQRLAAAAISAPTDAPSTAPSTPAEMADSRSDAPLLAPSTPVEGVAVEVVEAGKGAATAEERTRILELHAQGQSISAIARAVYNTAGGTGFYKVKQVVEPLTKTA